MEHLGAKVPFEVEVPSADLDDEAAGAGLILGLREHLVLTVLALMRVYVRGFELVLVLLGLFWVWMVKRVRFWKKR